MKIRKDKAYTNSRKMSVNVMESFKELLEMNEKSIEIVSKRMRKSKSKSKSNI